jgi:crotonobetainyl-CoA:carnitine CoA-transferase CaiB-like acyl-CoA transferase
MALDLKDQTAIEALYKIIPKVDVLLESYRPGMAINTLKFY